MAGPLRQKPTHPLELNGRWNVGKKGLNKKYFFFNGRPFTPPPLLMARPLREELFFRLPLVVHEFFFFLTVYLAYDMNIK